MLSWVSVSDIIMPIYYLATRICKREASGGVTASTYVYSNLRPFSSLAPNIKQKLLLDR